MILKLILIGLFSAPLANQYRHASTQKWQYMSYKNYCAAHQQAIIKQRVMEGREHAKKQAR